MGQGPEGTDRWSPSDWWGVVLDAPDVDVLARFYSALRGWPIWKQDATGAALNLGAGLPEHQPQENVRALLDPAGHPFCLYT